MTTITRSPLDEGYDFYITDNWNKEYHFKILTFEIPPGILSVAVEAAEETETYYPRRLEVLSDNDSDIELTERSTVHVNQLPNELSFYSLLLY